MSAFVVWSGVAAVSVLRQRGIDQVQDVDVDVDRERSGRAAIASRCCTTGAGTTRC
jgi:hypothetical protein